MLYKKYHRNFVRRFKKGFMFMYNNSRNKKVMCEVVNEPFVDSQLPINIRLDIIIKSGFRMTITIVYSSGRLEWI